MTAPSSIDPTRFLDEQLAQASPDLLRQLCTTFLNALMSADADAVCGAPYGIASPERTNVRNGYRHREFDTRAGTLDLAIPKLRAGSYYPGWLLEHRRRAERALTTVIATCYLLGVFHAADGEAGGDPRHHPPVPLPGQRDGPRAGRGRGGVSHPPAGRRPVHVRGRRRVGAQGPRGRPGRGGARPGRDRGER